MSFGKELDLFGGSPIIGALSLVDAGVAQLVEQRFCKPQVVGSIPFSSSRFFVEGYPSGQREQTVNLSALAFEGSNPSLSTISFFY